MLDPQSSINYSCLFMNAIQKIQLYHSNEVNLDETFSEVEKIAKLDYHKLSPRELGERFGTDTKCGLAAQEAKKVYKLNGPNQFRVRNFSAKGLCKKMWRICNLYFIVLFMKGVGLLISSILEAHVLEGAIMPFCVAGIMILFALGLLTLNAVLEIKSATLLKTPKLTSVEVIRLNQYQTLQTITIKPHKLVEGDLIRIKQNMPIPADIRLIEADNLVIDKTCNGRQGRFAVVANTSIRDNILRSDNMIFYPSLCVSGSGVGVVVGTGTNTIISRIVREEEQVKSAKSENSKIINNLYRFLGFLSILAYSMKAVYLFIRAGFGLTENNWFQAVVGSAGVIISFIPLTLPFQVYLMLAIFKRKSTAHNISVKDYLTLQRMREIDCLVIDVNGILTNNQSSLTHLYFNSQLTLMNHQLYDSFKPFQELRECVLLSNTENNAEVQNIVEYFKSTIKFPISKYQAQFPKLDLTQVYFKYRSTDPAKWFQILVRKYPRGTQSNYTIFVVGRVSVIWEKSTHVVKEGEFKPKSSKIKKDFEETVRNLENSGEKIIGFAKVHVSSQEQQLKVEHISFYIENLVFVGFVSLKVGIDSKAAGVIAEVRKAGIEVVLMSDDSFGATCCLSENLGLINHQRANTLRGTSQSDLSDQLSQKQLLISRKTLAQGLRAHKRDNKLVYGMKRWFTKVSVKQLIFSQLNSQQKNILINFLHKNQRKVCFITKDDKCLSMIRDLATSITYQNAKPLLKRASEIVLNGNEFSQIVDLIRISRDSYTNLKKSVIFNLSLQTSKILFIMLSMVFTRTFTPLISVLVCLEILAAFVPGICFAFEKSEEKALGEHPDSNAKGQFIDIPTVLQSYLLIGPLIFAGGVLSLFLSLYDYGFSSYYLLQSSLKNTYYSSVGNHYWMTSSGLKDLTMPYSPLVYQCRSEKMSTYAPTEYIPEYSICWTYEATRYAQWSFYGGVLVCQLFNIIVCQLRKKSIFRHRWNNSVMLFGAFASITLSLTLFYFKPIHSIFESKDNDLIHIGVNAAIIGVFLVLVNEVKKKIVSRFGRDQEGNRNVLSTVLEW